MVNKVNGVPQPDPKDVVITDGDGDSGEVSKSGEIYVAPLPANSVDVVQTTVDTSAVQIDVPEEASSVSIRHITEGTTLWVGNSSSITAGGAGTFPLLEGDIMEIDLIKGNSNEIYGILASGSITVYAIGAIRQ